MLYAAATMRLLIVNAGSSSLKLRLLGSDDAVVADRELPADGGRFDEDAAAAALAAMTGADAAGHRVVHGGGRHDAVVVDREVEAELRSLAELAPLHQAPALAGIALVRRELPELPSVACFDTAFHASLPPAASTYAIPREWREEHGARRYGFHGLSHAYAARRAAALLGRAPERFRAVTCHLGAGASLAAVRGGASVDTTMGFTPLEGLVMATRSGTVDPGLLLWLQERTDLSASAMTEALERRSGLLALAGSGDIRDVLTAIGAGDVEARQALDVYVHRLRAGIAAMTAAMDGTDAVVFTGGVGEHSHEVREEAARGLGFLGVAVDPGRNRALRGDGDVSARSARVRTLVVAAREDLEIARQVRRTLGAPEA